MMSKHLAEQLMKSKYKIFQHKVKIDIFDKKIEKPKLKKIDFDYIAVCFFMFSFVFLFIYSLLRDFLKIFFNIPVQ